MKHKWSAWIAALLALILLVSLIFTAFAASPDDGEASESKYENIPVNETTGEGGNPPELAADAAAVYFSKEWYEYLRYSEEPISSCRVDDTMRIIFYDPYEYGSSMVMEVTYDDSGWSTANTTSISHTFSNTFSYGKSTGSTWTSARQVQEGTDESGSNTHTESSSSSKSSSTSTSDSVRESTLTGGTVTTGSSQAVGSDTQIGPGLLAPGITETIKVNLTLSSQGSVTNNHTKESSHVESTDHTENLSESKGDSETTGWSRVADRVTTTTGSSSSTNTNWSATESTTITKTYNAAYFNASGAPLPWTIAYYEVKMPMKYALQVLVNGEWSSVEVGYCLLTTVEGACRAWRDNSVTYYEHWGNGEPVADTDFWGQFFTKEGLIEAYQSKLYPD